MCAFSKVWCDEHHIDIDSLNKITINIKGWSHLPPFSIKGYCKAVAEGLRDIEEKCEETKENERNSEEKS